MNINEKWFNEKLSIDFDSNEIKNKLNLLPIIDQAKNPEKAISDIEAIINKFKDFDNIVFLGTGGSSLGGKTIYDFLKSEKSKNLIFLDNIDPQTFFQTIKLLDLNKTGVVGISKSGNTCETLMQLMQTIKIFEDINKDIKEHFVLITENKINHAFNSIIEKFNIEFFEHPETVGGRYSCVTIVGLLPLALCGGNIYEYLNGAINYFNKGKDEVIENISIINKFIENGKTQSVFMPYRDSMQSMSFWYRQLWAESLGKKGLGSTPLNALGTVDQHSQLQLYIDGPLDKFYTILYSNIDSKYFGEKIDFNSSHPSITPLQDKNMEDLLKAEFLATSQVLIDEGLPVRTIVLEQTSEGIGALMMKIMLETIGVGYLMDIDPFDQPAVEKIKKLIYKNLD